MKVYFHQPPGDSEYSKVFWEPLNSLIWSYWYAGPWHYHLLPTPNLRFSCFMFPGPGLPCSQGVPSYAWRHSLLPHLQQMHGVFGRKNVPGLCSMQLHKIQLSQKMNELIDRCTVKSCYVCSQIPMNWTLIIGTSVSCSLKRHKFYPPCHSQGGELFQLSCTGF